MNIGDEREPLKAPMKPEERRKLEEFGLHEELAQSPVGIGDKSGGRTVLPQDNNQKETTTMQPGTDQHFERPTGQNATDWEKNFIDSQRDMGRDMRAMRESVLASHGWKAQTVRGATIFGAVFAGGTLAFLTANWLTKPKAPIPAPTDVVGLKK